MKIFLVIPTIRNLSFLAEWEGVLSDCHLIIVEDHPQKEIPTPERGFQSTHHFTWADIKKDFGPDEWIFPRQNAGIRSYGFWKACEMGADIIITLDDDCYPTDKNFTQQHVDNLTTKAPEGWFPTFPHPSYMYTRGFPYKNRERRKGVVSHGLWSNKMDMDAQTQLRIGDVNIAAYPPIRQFIPSGHYFPMSSMNLAFTREAAPLMYFPLMGKDPEGNLWGYDRFDDIWAGIFAKKVIDHMGYAVVNGSPFVEHRKASNPQVNLRKERMGLQANESLWVAIDRVRLTEKTLPACYKELARKVRFPDRPYFASLRRAMQLWIAHF